MLEAGCEQNRSIWVIIKNKLKIRRIGTKKNCHAAHHLFPNICNTNYDKINNIIEETTREFDLPYHKKTLVEMMISHFKHLKRMGG